MLFERPRDFSRGLAKFPAQFDVGGQEMRGVFASFSFGLL